MIPKMDIALNDFSGGEFDSDAKRMNGPVAQTGGRVMSNWRILNSRKMKNRPGRRVLFLESGRVDKVLMAPGRKFKIAFGAGTLRVYDFTGTKVFEQGGYGWTVVTAKSVVWCQDRQSSIYIFFAGQQPQVLSWDGVSTWTVTPYAETATSGNQKRTFFYRISAKSITLLPSAGAGNITLTASANLFAAGWVGTRIRYVGRQILITGFVDAQNVNATVEEPLPGSQVLGFVADPRTVFNLGDEVIGETSNSKGVVVAFIVATNHMRVQLLSTTTTSSVGISLPGSAPTTTLAFVANENVSGPGGTLPNDGVLSVDPPQAISIWDEEVMNSFRGWPASGFFDQNRLGLCNFPSVPSGIGWSAIGLPNDLYVEGTTQAAMFELVPNKSQVFYVVPGAEGSEFVFCDNRVYYIPISVGNPLKAGSVAFNQISSDGCYPVQPRPAGTAILFLPAGGIRVSAIIAIGATNRPYDIADLTELHSHLFNAPVAIAIPSADGQFTERYAYVLNGDGTVVVGKYTLDEQQQLKGVAGWLPWSGAGSVKWVAALDEDVLFTATYAPNGIAPVTLVEQLDDTQYLDRAMPVNAVPAALTPPGGLGPFWWIAGGAVHLMDQSTRSLGTYQIDANGFIVPQFIGGEDLTSATLVGGQAWIATFEPIVPHAPPGQDAQQRMRRRKIIKAAVSVQSSSGFIFGGRRVPAYNIDDDATKPPPLRESTFTFRPKGRAYDPRQQLIKDDPGPLVISEIGLEVTA